MEQTAQMMVKSACLEWARLNASRAATTAATKTVNLSMKCQDSGTCMCGTWLHTAAPGATNCPIQKGIAVLKKGIRCVDRVRKARLRLFKKLGTSWPEHGCIGGACDRMRSTRCTRQQLREGCNRAKDELLRIAHAVRYY